MGLPENIMTSGIKIIDSYERYAKTVVGLIKETASMLEESCKEDAEMIGQLRENLANAEGLRKKDFDNLMQGILCRRTGMIKELKDSLAGLWKEEEEMVRFLKEALTRGGSFALETMKRVCLARNKEKEAVMLLMRLHIEQSELNSALKGLLSKGEKIRIREFKAVARAAAIRQKGRLKEIESLIDDFSAARDEVRGRWQGLIAAYEMPFSA